MPRRARSQGRHGRRLPPQLRLRPSGGTAPRRGGPATALPRTRQRCPP